MSTSILRPGYLVSLSARIAGGISYERIQHGTRRLADGSEVAEWETTRTIVDPEEYERAVQVRGKARGLISRACHATAFGLMASKSREAELDAAIVEAKALVAEFNAGASFSQVSIYVLRGEVAATDQEAARALAAETAGLLDEMRAAIERADAGAVRDAAKRAREVGAMLAPERSAAVADAIKAARKAARDIVRRIEKKGEEAAAVLAELDLGPLDPQRFAFLDLDAPIQIEGEAMPSVDAQRFDGLDLAPAEPETPETPETPEDTDARERARELDLAPPAELDAPREPAMVASPYGYAADLEL